MEANPLELCFPKLATSGYRITSPATPSYNCIAWAGGDNQNWWWPVPLGGYFWPAGVAQAASVASFMEAFARLGYEPVSDPGAENGFETIAIYVDENGEATHMARQLGSGKWTSKLGESEDIEHGELSDLEGDCYGEVAQIMRRPRPSPAPH